ncbi:hypothetical protein Tco_0783106, partial [Tanacetum coccineum]
AHGEFLENRGCVRVPRMAPLVSTKFMSGLARCLVLGFPSISVALVVSRVGPLSGKVGSKSPSNNVAQAQRPGTPSIRHQYLRVWAAAMKLAINTRNKTGFLDETCLKSTYANSDPMSNQWEKCNSIVLSWLLNSVSKDLFLGQIFSDNASEVWTELKETYDKLDGEFHIMTKFPKCSCAAREDVSKHNQLIKLMQFLMGLNDVLQPIRSSLLSRETLLDVKDAFAIISREESHRGIASSSSSSSSSMTKPQVGHTVDRCFDIIGYPPGYNKNPGPKPNGPRTFNANSVFSSSKKGASLSFTNKQMMKLMNLINETLSGSVQANMAGHPNGTPAKIKYVEILKLSDKIVLFDVLVVPEYCVSLLFVNKLYQR